MIETPNLLLENQQLREENQKKDLRISKLEKQLEQLLRTIYGNKSEKFIDPKQISLPLDVTAVPTSEIKEETITYKRKKSSGQSNHKGRLPIPDHLKRVDVILSPKEDVTGLVKIGEEITEQLEYEPGNLFVKRYIRSKYANPQGEGIIIAPLPSFIIDKAIAGPGLLAFIVIQKYVDHLPLYRQIGQFKRQGIEIPSSTMSDWVGMCLKELTPLYKILKAKILSGNYLQADETPIKVLDQKGTPHNSHRGYYWVYRDPQSGLVLFDYQKGRSREGPSEILKDFEGYLQSDGYRAYESFDKNKIKLIHCMTHARRYFDWSRKDYRAPSEYVLTELQKLYAVEKQARENNFTHEQRFELRQKDSMPVLKSLHTWLKENSIQYLPKTLIGEAICYALNRWEKLMVYANDGKLEIDNNLVENSIRPIAIGRKNYLFAGSHDAAQRAAMIYSLLGTCKLKGVEPFQWLKNVFEVLPDWKFNRLEELLP